MDYAQTILALIALAAVIVGPLVSLAIAKRQIRAQLVSANRLKWTEGLRSEVSDIMSLTPLWANQKTIDSSLLQRTIRANILLITRLNPHDDTHAHLKADAQRLSQLATLIHSKRMPDGDAEIAREWNSLSDTLIDHTQKALKNEWELIHRGE